LVGELRPARVVFWLLVLTFVFTIVGYRQRRKPAVNTNGDFDVWTAGTLRPKLFGDKAVMQSLVVFNLLFLLQTGSDAVFLWSGFELPDGMSYAEYAHRGAYPLLATSLLAITFILFSMRREGPGERNTKIRLMLYVWVAQNLLLVASSLYRLQLYVNEYSLTGLRFAAAIWMGMVFFGLVTILVRIWQKRDNKWLMSVNWVVVVAVFLFSSLFDFDHYIAQYNVEHSYEMSGEGQPLDLKYLKTFGPGALPAVEHAYANRDRFFRNKSHSKLETIRDDLRRDIANSECKDFRCWSARRARYEATFLQPTQQAIDAR
jgi:hypothetical protein